MIIDNLYNTINSELKNIITDISNLTTQNFTDYMDNCIQMVTSRRNYLSSTYTYYNSNITSYAKFINKELYNRDEINLKYLDEKYCKDVPNTNKIDYKRISPELANIISYNNILDAKLVDNPNKLCELDSSTMKKIRWVIYNPGTKSNIKKIEYKNFVLIKDRIFSTPKTLSFNKIHNRRELSDVLQITNITTEYSNIRELINDTIEQLELIKNSHKYRINKKSYIDSDKSKNDYIASYTKAYMTIMLHMIDCILSVYVNKNTVRLTLIKESYDKIFEQ